MKKKVFLSFAALTAAFTMNAQSKLPVFKENLELGQSVKADFVKPAKQRTASATDVSYYYWENNSRVTKEISDHLAANPVQVQIDAAGNTAPLEFDTLALYSYKVANKLLGSTPYWQRLVQGIPTTAPINLTKVRFLGKSNSTTATSSNVVVKVYDKDMANVLASKTLNISTTYGWKDVVFDSPVATSDTVLVTFEMATAADIFQVAYSHNYFKGGNLKTMFTGVVDAAYPTFNSALPFVGDAAILATNPNQGSILGLIKQNFDFFIIPSFTYDLNTTFTASKTTACLGDSVNVSTPANGLILNPVLNYIRWNELANGANPLNTVYKLNGGDEDISSNFGNSFVLPVGTHTIVAKGVMAPWIAASLLEDSTVLNITVGKTAGTLTGANAVCSGSTTTFTPSVAGGTWLVSAGTASASVVNGVVTGKNTAGTATIRYSITGAGVGCASLVTKTITVNARPSAGTLTGSNYVCRNSSVKLTPSVAGGTWTSLKPSIASVDAQGNVTGLMRTSFVAGVVSYSVTNANGCTASITKGLGVDSLPVVPIIAGPAKICANGTAFFRTTNTAGVLWTAGPSLSASSAYQGVFTHRNATNGAVPSDNFNTFVKATSYSINKVCTSEATKAVQLRTAASKSVTISAANNLVVNANTPVSVTFPSGLTTSNTSSRFWISSASADMSVVSTTNLSTTVKALKVPTVAPKLYFSAIETSTGCGITAYKQFTVTASQSIVDANNDVNTTIGVNVYPNPSNGVVTFENIAGANAISLVDMTGRTVKTVAVNADRMTVDFSGVQNGKYLVQVAGENVNEVRSIVIE